MNDEGPPRLASLRLSDPHAFVLGAFPWGEGTLKAHLPLRLGRSRSWRIFVMASL